MQEELVEWARDIINWNYVAKSGDEDYDQDLQAELCREELRELKEALEEGLTLDVVAEACDLFVVVSYHYYKQYEQVMMLEPMDRSIDFCMERIEALFLEDNYSEALVWVNSILNKLDGVKDVMECKLASNWTKLPTFSEYCRAVDYGDLREKTDLECDRIEQGSNGRYLGVFAEVVLSSNAHVIFKDGETKKILKPLTYKSWEDIFDGRI